MTSAAFFLAAKIVGALIRVETWLLLLLVIAFGASLRGRHRLARRLTGAATLAVLLLTVLPVGPWAIRPLEAEHPPRPALAAPPDAIIVLGGAVQVGMWRRTGLAHTNEAGERLTEAAVLARRFPDARLILTGGSGALSALSGIPVSEADAMAALLVDLGVDPDRMLLEEASRNTAANARFALELVSPRADQSFVLVTSASHMPRALAAFRHAGWPNVTPWPVDFTPGAGAVPTWNMARNLEVLNRAVKEYVGRVAYAAARRF